MVVAFSQIFYGFPLSCAFVMRILINRISWNVAPNDRPHLQTYAWLNRGGIPPRTTFLDSHDQTSHIHSLTWALMTAFTRPQTISCPQIRPPAQHIYKYILLGLSHSFPTRRSSDLVRLNKHCLEITSSLMRSESQLQSIQCGGSSFPLDIS